MAVKKYTLYLKGKNKYGHEHDIPIVSLDLKSMDLYTSNYKSYDELYSFLPIEIKDFFKENLSYNLDIKNNLYITDNDFTPIMDIIFENNEDVLYITEDELCEMIVKMKMTHQEYQKELLSMKKKKNKKLEFFKYLYDTYVKNEKIACMIDVYDTSKVFSNLKEDELLLASIATNKDNIIILCKKLGQNLESRRNLAFKFKDLFNTIDSSSKMINESFINERKNMNLNIDEIGNEMLDNFRKFKVKYEKEYK